MPVTNRDLTLRVFDLRHEIVLPKGTRLERVDGPGPAYAVADVALLVRLTGNAFDPKYRYVFVPDDAVTEGETP